MSSKVKNRRTKAEVQQEFAVVAEETAAEKIASSSKETMASQMKEAEIRAAVSEISVEVIIHKLANLNNEISKSLSNLSEKLVGEVALLGQVRSAITMEHQHLEKLHKIDIAATALDQMVEDYQQKKLELELEAQTMRAEWEKERKNQEEASFENDRNLKNSRLREMDEYKYERDLERKKEQDKYEEEQRLQEKKNSEKQETLEKSWQLREELLKGRETHLQELQNAVDTFPARLEEEVGKVRAQTVAQTEARLSQQLLLVQKDRETESRISEMKIKSLDETGARLHEQVVQLQKQLEEAKKEVKEIAEKAIEGASGARALSHINQIAMEQAKNRSSTG